MDFQTKALAICGELQRDVRGSQLEDLIEKLKTSFSIF